MKKLYRHKILSYVSVSAFAIVLLSYYFLSPPATPVFAPAARFPGETVILDAGHGGEDGGAVSLSGVPESGINLAITQRLDLLLAFYGIHTFPLRTEDISLHDDEAKTLRQKKVSDLHNRADRINATENATLISIHQNTYSNARYHGAQVFYGGEVESSMLLAQSFQETLRLNLDPSNNRSAAKIPENVYLMNHVTCPAVLVECGFLSNPEEDRLLQDSGYQTKLAVVLAGAYLSFRSTAAN